MKRYTIIGGVNGVGKSSFTGVLKGSRDDLGQIIDVDKITAQLGGDALSGYRTERTARKAREAGYSVRLYYVGLNTPEESLQRIENRVRRGGHDIDREDVLRRFAGRWEAVEKVLPYCDTAEFYDNDNGFRLVAEYRNGELLQVSENRPTWILELRDYLRDK